MKWFFECQNKIRISTRLNYILNRYMAKNETYGENLIFSSIRKGSLHLDHSARASWNPCAYSLIIIFLK